MQIQIHGWKKRLTTFILEYPRYLHAELLTHRVFSKNSASSRAIPIEKMMAMTQANPVIPKWTLNQKGMQGEIVQDLDIKNRATQTWLTLNRNMINGATELSKLGIHKQNVNRLLEPWQYIRIILTGTEFDNWFALRDHAAAHPEIQELAKKMKIAMDESLPIYLEPGEWHLPFGDRVNEDNLRDSYMNSLCNEGYSKGSEEEWEKLSNEANRRVKEDLLKISVARCARISYNTFEGEFDYNKDIELFEKLVVSEPLHASPAEHQAQVPTKEEVMYGIFDTIWAEIKNGLFEQNKGWAVSNLIGWKQYRKLIEKEKWKNNVNSKIQEETALG